MNGFYGRILKIDLNEKSFSMEPVPRKNMIRRVYTQ